MTSYRRASRQPARSEEPRCATQRADVLVAMEDITAKVNAATRGLDDKAANDKRRMTLTALEQACEQASGRTQPLKCESVTLYQGGQYFLYKYKRYSDVRLVFAPEDAIAAFGGDPDNFQFPRWDLDFSILRAYENGKPAATPDYLQDRLGRTRGRRSRCSCPAIRAPPIGCSPSRNCSAPPSTSTSGCCATPNCAAG